MNFCDPEVGDLVLLTDDAAGIIGASKCLVLGFKPHFGLGTLVEVLAGSKRHSLYFAQIKEIL